MCRISTTRYPWGVSGSLDDLVTGAAAELMAAVAGNAASISERVLANLVSNALRFSPPQSPPSITASLLDAAGTERRIELRVIDHGPGIPEVDHERAFVPFQRLGDRDTTVGVGLGLAVARGLAEALGGGLEPEETPADPPKLAAAKG